MKNLRFFRCKHCGNVVVKLLEKGASVQCCGEPMEELVPNTVEASFEKHLPVIEVKKGIATVKVGSVPHPMEEAHYINFIALETEENCFVATLKPKAAPEAKFVVGDAKVLAAYEYCNLHGLWKTEIK